MSVSCGIPDFRSRGGIYARLAVDFPDLPDPQAMFDIEYFRRDPRPFFKFAKVCSMFPLVELLKVNIYTSEWIDPVVYDHTLLLKMLYFDVKIPAYVGYSDFK